MVKSSTGDDGVRDARRELNALKAQLSAQVRMDDYSPLVKTPFKVESARQILAHRLVDLGLIACDLYETRHTVAATILTRAAVEVFACLYLLEAEIGKLLESRDVVALDRWLMNLHFGTRVPELQGVLDEPFVATNVMTALGKVDRTLPGTKQAYERLSEIAHPNAAGLGLAYGTIDSGHLELDLLKYQPPAGIGGNVLAAITTVGRGVYEGLPTRYEQVTRVCEADFDARKNG